MIKKLLKSKTAWMGMASVGFGIYLITQGGSEEGIAAIGAGLGMIFLREAVEKKGTK